MGKSVEVVILGALSLLSLALGWAVGKGERHTGMMLFFSLVSILFFLAMFRSRSW